MTKCGLRLGRSNSDPKCDQALMNARFMEVLDLIVATDPDGAETPEIFPSAPSTGGCDYINSLSSTWCGRQTRSASIGGSCASRLNRRCPIRALYARIAVS